MSSELHDLLREHGLVPPDEDVHFVACSTDWRQNVNAASDWLIDPDDYAALEKKAEAADDRISELESEVSSLECKIEDIESERDGLKDDVMNLEQTIRELESK